MSKNTDWIASNEKRIGITVAHLALFFVPAYFSWDAFLVFVVMYWVTLGLGVTLCYHRLLAHRSFWTPKWVEYLMATCATLALQGGPIEWVGTHRLHHRHSDKEMDPHNARKGFWWSHILWLYSRVPSEEAIRKKSKDLNGDPYYEWLHKRFMVPQLILALLLFALGGWAFVVYGIFLRIVVVFHVTWLVNSANHKFGYRNYETKDLSTNCWWVALLTFGEGWHNNHHAKPFSARHGLRWFEIDMTYMIIWGLKQVGLAKDIKIAVYTD